jgi:hypothetical protein
MRLREMQHIVRAEIGKLKEITFGAVVVGQTQYQDVAHWRRALEGVNALIAVAPLADQATRCVGAPWGKLAGEPGRIEPNEGNQIQLTIAALTQRADVPAGMDVDKKNEAKAAVVAGAFKVAELLDRKARFIPSLPEGEGQEAGHEAIKHWPSADEIRYVLHSSPIAQLAEQNTPKKKE